MFDSEASEERYPVALSHYVQANKTFSKEQVPLARPALSGHMPAPTPGLHPVP